MYRPRFTLVALAGVLLFGAAQVQAQDDFVPEILTVEERIQPGANLFVLDQSWSGASRANVLSVDDLSMKGNLSFGITGQIVASKDFKTLYSMSAYAKRITYGPTEAVLQEFDVETLSLKREIIIPEKAVQVAPSNAVVTLSHDDNYAFVQNATPATSVTVVDLKAGAVIQEVPTPGCFGIFPATDAVKFTTVCGDGRFQTFHFGDNGQFGSPERSEKIFDAETDPLFIVGKRAGRELVFVSFNGNVYQVSDSGKAARLTKTFSFTEGVEGGWAPGGVDVAAYNLVNNTLFVTMHSESYNGSHKNAAEEVWAIDLRRSQVVSRTEVHELASIAVTSGRSPVLFGLNEEGVLTRYALDAAKGFALEETHSLEGVGDWAIYAIAGQ